MPLQKQTFTAIYSTPFLHNVRYSFYAANTAQAINYAEKQFKSIDGITLIKNIGTGPIGEVVYRNGSTL